MRNLKNNINRWYLWEPGTWLATSDSLQSHQERYAAGTFTTPLYRWGNWDWFESHSKSEVMLGFKPVSIAPCRGHSVDFLHPKETWRGEGRPQFWPQGVVSSRRHNTHPGADGDKMLWWDVKGTKRRKNATDVRVLSTGIHGVTAEIPMIGYMDLPSWGLGFFIRKCEQ